MKKYACKTFIRTVLVVASIAAITVGVAQSDEDKHHEEVLKQREMKDILPFDAILSAIRPLIKGEIIETEFEMEDGVPAYEFKYIDQSGHVREMYVNAKTGGIIKDESD